MEKLPHFLEDIGHELKAIECAEMFTPSKVRRYFLLLLQTHWSSRANWGPDLADSLGCMEWSPTGDTGVDIQLYGATKLKDSVPGISIKFGNVQGAQKTFGNRTDGYEEDNATELLELPCTSQLLFTHYAATTDQAYDMAYSTFCFLLGFAEPIMGTIGASGFAPQLMGEPNMLEQDPDPRFRVDVGAQLNFNVAVATTVESHRLKQLIILLSEQ
jgi:hypothetical protein